MGTESHGITSTSAPFSAALYGSASVALAAHLATLAPALAPWRETITTVFNGAFAVVVGRILFPPFPRVGRAVGVVAAWTGRVLVAPLRRVTVRCSVNVHICIGGSKGDQVLDDDHGRNSAGAKKRRTDVRSR